MNNKLQEFIAGLSALTEIWTLTYRNFIKQGWSTEEALMHTSAFIGTMMENIQPNQGEE
jgi:hypothetical protein